MVLAAIPKGGIRWKEQPTMEGDEGNTLAGAYQAAFPAGQSAASIFRCIVERNGQRWTTKAVDGWIFSLSKKRRPYVEGNSPGEGLGWAYFAQGNRILLPDVPRNTAYDPKPSTPTKPPPAGEQEPAALVKKKTPYLWYGLGAAALSLIGLSIFGFFDSKKPKKEEA